MPTVSPGCRSRRTLIFLVVGLSASLIVGGALWWLVFKPTAPKLGPVIQVVTAYPGISAEEVEKTITDPIERSANQAQGVERIESKSVAGVSVVTVYFRDDIDRDTALTTTNLQALSAQAKLPPNTLPSVVLPCNDSVVGIVTVENARLGPVKLYEVARHEVRNMLMTVRGSALPGVVGGKDPIALALRAARAAKQFPPADIMKALDEHDLFFKPAVSLETSPVRKNGRSAIFLPVYFQEGAHPAQVAEDIQKMLPDIEKRVTAGGTTLSFLPAEDRGLITISLRAPSGLGLEATEKRVAKFERFLEETIPAAERRAFVTEIGCTQDVIAAFRPNASAQDATIQLWLSPRHQENAEETVGKLRAAFVGKAEFADLQARFTTGGLDATARRYGSPAAVNIQVSGGKLEQAERLAQEIRRQVATVKDAADVQVVQRLDAPELRIELDRQKAAQIGLSAKEVFVQAAAALGVTVPPGRELWIDKAENSHVLRVPYPQPPEKTLEDALNTVVRGNGVRGPIKLGSLVRIQRTTTAVEINHVDLRRTVNILVNHATGGDARRLADAVEASLRDLTIPEGMRIKVQTLGRRAR